MNSRISYESRFFFRSTACKNIKVYTRLPYDDDSIAYSGHDQEMELCQLWRKKRQRQESDATAGFMPHPWRNRAPMRGGFARRFEIHIFARLVNCRVEIYNLRGTVEEIIRKNSCDGEKGYRKWLSKTEQQKSVNSSLTSNRTRPKSEWLGKYNRKPLFRKD